MKPNAQAVAKYRQKVARAGGRARMAKLTPAERSDLGRRAVQARWAKHRKSLSKISSKKTSSKPAA